MTDNEFAAFIQRLKAYFDRPKYATWERHAMWYKKIAHIPTEAIPYIENCFYDHRDILPANLPRYMCGYFIAWKNANSNKIINYPRTACEECNGKGLLWIKRPAMINGEKILTKNGYVMEVVSYRCAFCENWLRHCNAKSKLSATKNQLIEKGFILS